MNIEDINNINEIFSIFHDGKINHFKNTDSNLIIDIEIKYLTNRINDKYTKFHLDLENVESIIFSTWPNISELESEIITDEELIFKPELIILSSEVKNNLISVACSQNSHEFEYCGGDLILKAKYATVKDESGKVYSLQELNTLSNEYWDEWSNNA